jgi:hypothetical protein
MADDLRVLARVISGKQERAVHEELARGRLGFRIGQQQAAQAKEQRPPGGFRNHEHV